MTLMAEAELPVMGTGAGAATTIEGRLPPPPAGLTIVDTLAELLAHASIKLTLVPSEEPTAGAS